VLLLPQHGSCFFCLQASCAAVCALVLQACEAVGIILKQQLIISNMRRNLFKAVKLQNYRLMRLYEEQIFCYIE